MDIHLRENTSSVLALEWEEALMRDREDLVVDIIIIIIIIIIMELADLAWEWVAMGIMGIMEVGLVD